MPTSKEHVSDDALRQQLNYWREKSTSLGDQLSSLLFELQERRGDTASVGDRGSDSVSAVGNADRLGILARAAYVTSGPHLSGYRLILGFETLADVSEAHQAIADIQRGAVETTLVNTSPSKIGRIATILREWGGGRDEGYMFEALNSITEIVLSAEEPSAPCAACEGWPKEGNNPCAVCGLDTRPVTTEKAQCAHVWVGGEAGEIVWCHKCSVRRSSLNGNGDAT